MPAGSYDTPAILLGRQDYGEADRIVRLLSPEYGRISAIARSARRPGRRFSGGLEPGNSIKATLRDRPGGLSVLEASDLLDGHLSARDNLESSALLAHCVELAGGLAREYQPEPRLYGLLQTALLLLDASTALPSRAFRLGFDLKALTFAGLRPLLDRCVRCGEVPASNEAICLVETGQGVAHFACAPHGTPIHADFLQALREILQSPLRELLDLAIPEGPPEVFSEAAEAFLGRPLLARRLLQSLEPPCR